MELKEQILNGTIEVFNEKGLKFTMDDLATKLKMSKKTLYTVFRTKEDLFISMVEYLFDSISTSENDIFNNPTLSTTEKIRKILGVLPENYKNIDFRQLHSLKSKYPTIYAKVEERLESGWDATIALIEQGKREGVIKDVNISIVKLMLEASLEQFFQRDILLQIDMSYSDALNEVVNIITDGIIE